MYCPTSHSPMQLMSCKLHAPVLCVCCRLRCAITGNDMSRYLRWGAGLSSAGDLHLEHFVKDCDKAETIQMNRWKIKLTPPPKDTTAFGSGDSTTFMNYFSVGVDAKIAHDFER